MFNPFFPLFSVVIIYSFLQDECKRLRQSIKCGLIKRFTVVGLLIRFTDIVICYVQDICNSSNKVVLCLVAG